MGQVAAKWKRWEANHFSMPNLCELDAACVDDLIQHAGVVLFFPYCFHPVWVSSSFKYNRQFSYLVCFKKKKIRCPLMRCCLRRPLGPAIKGKKLSTHLHQHNISSTCLAIYLWDVISLRNLSATGSSAVLVVHIESLEQQLFESIQHLRNRIEFLWMMAGKLSSVWRI
jgi:hypothetical protein